jgi:hypothetical protein
MGLASNISRAASSVGPGAPLPQSAGRESAGDRDRHKCPRSLFPAMRKTGTPEEFSPEGSLLVFALGGNLPLDGTKRVPFMAPVEHPRPALGQSRHPGRDCSPNSGLDIGQGDLTICIEGISDHVMKQGNHSPSLIARKLGGNPKRMKDTR